MKILLSLLMVTMTTFACAEEEIGQAIEPKGFILHVAPKNAEMIEEIVTTMGKSSVIALGFKQSHLKALGKQLRGTGALQFLGYIFANDHLATYMRTIHKSSLKWNGFMDSLKPGLNREANTGEIYHELPDFAKFAHADHQKLLDAAMLKDWDGFVSVLIDSYESTKAAAK